MPKPTASSKSEVVADRLKSAEIQPPKASDYDTIVEKNLFSPDRIANIPAPDSSPVVEELKISGEKIMLFGVVMLDGYKSALINNPGKESDGKEFRWVKKGDQLGNLKITDIQKDQLSLNDGVSEYKISLFDPKKEAQKGSKTPGTQWTPPTGSNKEEASSPNIVSATSSKKEEPKTGAPPPPAEPVNKKPSQQKVNKGVSADDQYETIDTPFGTMQRKLKK